MSAQTFTVGAGTTVTSITQLANQNPTVFRVINGTEVRFQPNIMGATIHVNGVFTLDKSVVFDIPVNWNMGTGAFLRANKSLELHGSRFISVGGTLWRGIQVMQSDSRSGLTLTGCTIQDAYQAVSFVGNFMSVHIYTTTFENNYVSLYHNSATPETLRFGKFMNNIFKCTANLLPGYIGMPTTRGKYSFAALELHNSVATGSAYYDASGSVGWYRNQIYDHNTGILIDKSTVNFHDLFSYHDSRPKFTDAPQRYDGAAVAAINSSTLTLTGINAEYFWFNKIGIYANASDLYTKDMQTAEGDAGIQVFNGAGRRISIIHHHGVIRHIAIDISNCDGASSCLIERNEMTMISLPGLSLANMVAIRITGNNQTLNAQINDNIINQGYGAYGLILQNVNDVLVVGNKFTSGISNAVIQNAYSELVAYVYINACRGVKLERNEIKSEIDPVIYPNITHLFTNNLVPVTNTVNGVTTTEQVGPVGLLLQNTPNISLCNNDIANMYTNILMRDVSASSTRMMNNTIGNAHFGVYFTNSLQMDFQDHTGNTWYGTYTGKAAKHNGDPITQGAYTGRLQGSFDVNNAQTPPQGGSYLAPSIQVKPTLSTAAWIKTDFIIPNQTSCAIAVQQASGPNPAEALYDETIATEGANTSVYEPEITKWSQRDLYYKLKQNPDMMSNNAILSDFKDSLAATSVANWYDLDETIKTATKGNAVYNAMVASDFTALNTAETDLMRIDSTLRANNSTPTAAETLTLDSLATIVQQKAIAYQTNQATAKNLRLIALANTINDNLNLLTDEQHITNQKQVNAIYLDTYAQENMALDAAQIAALEGIAQQCPIVGGSGVYHARSILTHQGDYTYNDDALCTAVGISFKIKPKNTPLPTEIQVFPNPCTNTLFINLNKNNIENTTITLTDVLGRVVNETSTVNNKHNINTESLPNGAYILKIEGISQSFIQKIIIFK